MSLNPSWQEQTCPRGSQEVGKALFVLAYSSAHRYSTVCSMQKIAVYCICHKIPIFFLPLAHLPLPPLSLLKLMELITPAPNSIHKRIVMSMPPDHFGNHQNAPFVHLERHKGIFGAISPEYNFSRICPFNCILKLHRH